MKYTLIPVLLLLHVFAFSQKNFVPGTVVTAKGDSLQGEIDDRNWSKNPRSINFKTGTEQVTYGLADLDGFFITGGDHFVKAVVQRSTRPVEVEQLRNGFKDTVVTDTVFLRQLVKGKWNLYFLNVDKPIYYYSTGDGQPIELQYRIDLDPASIGYFKRPVYRNQLEAILLQLDVKEDYTKKLEKMEYKEKDLAGFFDLLNEGQGAVISRKPQEKKKLLRFYVGAGVSFNQFQLRSTKDPLLQHLDMGGSVRPTLQAGMDFASGKAPQRLVGRLDLSWYQFVSSGKGYTYSQFMTREKETDYTLEMNNFKTSIFIQYHFIARPTLRMYGGVGYGLNFASYKQNRMVVYEPESNQYTTYDDYAPFEKIWSQRLLFQAGVIFNTRFDAGMTYGWNGSFTSYSYNTVKPSYLQLQFNYRF